MHRINDFIITDKTEIISLFAPFNKSLTILDFSLINNSMSNTGYVVTTNSGKFFLKLYSNTTDKIESAVFSYLEDKISVPTLLFYDGSKQCFPFAYAITEFIDGITFIQHVRTNLEYPPNMSYEIGRICATMHERKYTHDALLDENLNISQKLPRIRENIMHLLNGKPSEYLKSQTIEKLCKFIKENSKLFDKIEAESVLCHGDFGYGNIMVSGEKIYIIDFEFAYSGSIYNDIGRFFRRKDNDVQALVDRSIYDSFAQGYNSISASPLPSNWLTLAHLCDINAMLCLLIHDNVPTEWVKDIEYDILCAINEGIYV